MKILKNNTFSTEEIVQKTAEKDLRKTMDLLFKMELEGLIVNEIGVGYKIK